MKQLIACTVFLAVFASCVHGQTLFSRDYDLPGEANSDGSVVQSADGNNVFLSEMFSTSSSVVTSLVLYKTDPAGNIIWENHWLPPVGHSATGNVVTFPDSTILFAVLTTFNQEIEVTKTGDNGVVFFKSAIAAPMGHSYLLAPICFARNDGSCLISGSVADNATGDYLWYVISIDETGNLQWTKYYNRTANKVYLRDLDTCSNGDIILLGEWSAMNTTYDVGTLLIRITSDGAMLWSKPWYVPAENMRATKLQVMPGDFIFVSGQRLNLNTAATGAFITRYTGAGNVIWSYNYSFPNMYPRKILEVNDHLTIMGESNYDAVMAGIDSAGTVLWAKKYYNTRPYDLAYSATGYVFSTQSNSNGVKLFSVTGTGSACIDSTLDATRTPASLTPQAQSYEDTLIFTQNARTDSLLSVTYTVTTNCLNIGIEETEVSGGVQIYPNPSSENFTVHCDEIIESIELFDPQGRLIQQYEVNSTDCTLRLQDLPAGIYVVRICTESGIQSARLIAE